MIRSTAFASLAILGALALSPTFARAQAPMDGTVMPAPTGNVVGGGGATLSGGGDDRTITYSGGGAGGGRSYEQPGRIGTFGGNSGGNPYWIYNTPAPSGGGREAWLLGGGADSQVIYIDPTGARRR
jgi:hypothetical protein